MVISTKNADSMLKRALGARKTCIVGIDRMIPSFALDPTVDGEPKDVFVVTNEDITSAKLKQKFEAAAAVKHPKVKIIFINKNTKNVYPNGLPGIDAILTHPKVPEITQAISTVSTSDIAEMAVAKSDTYTNDIPKFDSNYQSADMTGLHADLRRKKEEELAQQQAFDPASLGGMAPIGMPDGMQQIDPNLQFQNQPVTDYAEAGFDPNAQVDYTQEYTEDMGEKLPIEPVPDVAPQIESAAYDMQSNLVSRINEASRVSDVSVLAREITATALIKDLVDTNSTYAGIEDKLKSINDMVFMILADNGIKSLDEKLSKIHSLMHDKAFFASKGDTLIEQRLEEVIDTICTQTSSLLQSRLQEIDTAIRRSYTTNDSEKVSARLAGLNEERANLIIELHRLEYDINEIFKSTDNLAIDVATKLAESASTVTANDSIINEHILARGGNVVSNETFTAIKSILELSAGPIPDTFTELKLKIVTLLRMLSKVFEIDQEIIAAQQAELNFFKARNVEDSIIAETILKKALRVYVGEEGTGRSIIPYLISRYKSRQNANVLCIDLTGTAKYAKYGIRYTAVDTYLTELNQKDFMLVAGAVDSTVEVAQRIVTALIKSADYYRVINVVLTPEQHELFQTIAQDVYSVNFVVDTNIQHIEKMKSIIEEHTMPNVGRRVIVNKCDVPIRTIINKLGLSDTLDFQICVVPSMPVVVDANLNGYNPYGISSVDLVMEDVVKHA